MMGRPGLPAALFLLALSGCAGFIGSEKASDTPGTEASVPEPAPQRRPTAEAATDTPVDAPTSEQESRPAEAVALPDVSPDVPDEEKVEGVAAQKMPDFDRLMGLAFGAVEKVLGPADAQTDVPPARNWVYREDGCRLVISFYPDLEALDYRVLSYRIEVEDQGAGNDDNAALEGCKARFRERLHIAGSSD